MPYVNEHYLKLKAGYLFPEIARRVREFSAKNPDAKIIRMGIGDVTEPLTPASIEAMHKAVDEMANRETFKGYGPEQGYDFLREAIAKNDFAARGASIAADEVFVSDGSKCDCANILDILGSKNVIAVTDPVYPVYVDTNVMAGHTGEADEKGEYAGLVYLRATADNGFIPAIPSQKVDVVYLCSPNNPTGATMTREQLAQWVEYARKNGTLVLFDAAYEAFITDPSVPHSIYEIPGATECAIEFRSFSKTAGFTGTRCAYTVVPKALKGKTSTGEVVDLFRLWTRRHTTKFNGISYIIQKGAEAIFTDAGKQQTKALVEHYLANAKLIRDSLAAANLTVFGGVNAPYCWVQTPKGIKSWDFFDHLLNNAHVVCTPGAGFGSAGEGYVRFSAFNSRANVEEAMKRVVAKL